MDINILQRSTTIIFLHRTVFRWGVSSIQEKTAPRSQGNTRPLCLLMFVSALQLILGKTYLVIRSPFLIQHWEFCRVISKSIWVNGNSVSRTIWNLCEWNIFCLLSKILVSWYILPAFWGMSKQENKKK